MNHARIAEEALRLRHRTLTNPRAETYDVERAARVAVACADPAIDRAIRLIGTAWRHAGLESARIGERWTDEETTALCAAGGWELIDALDDIVRGVARQTVVG